MNALRSMLTLFWFMRRRRAFDSLVDDEALALIEEHEPEIAYQRARTLERAAHLSGDRRTAYLFAKVARRVADVTGRHIGPIERWRSTARYGSPRRRIRGRKTERL